MLSPLTRLTQTRFGPAASTCGAPITAVSTGAWHSCWWFQGNGIPPANGDPQLVHADNHAIVFHPNYNGDTNQTLYIGDDGGIYKTDNANIGNVGYVNGTSPSGGTITSDQPHLRQ